MTQAEQINNAKDFADFWADKGDEKQHTHQFWTDLLQNVLGTVSPSRVIDFEKRVKIGATKFIDGYIEETRTIIEQKGAKIDLDAKEKQSDGAELTPFEQAKRYNDNLPLSQKARWIVVSNFTEFHIHDMEKAEPEKNFETIRLANLPREYYRLQFLVDQKNENIRREEEISLKAGILVGKLYDAIFPQYKNPEESSLRSLNILCVRIVFCLYAEDAGLFATRTAFEDYIKGFNLPNVRKGLIELFRALDTPLSDRDQYDESLKPFPYVNGGLFRDEQIEIPNFTQEIVDVIVKECAPFNWSEISPTIFGAVFESTLNPETRRKGGMHYTSIQNIHKVIDPLFLDDLNAEFDEICGNAASEKKNAVVERKSAVGGQKSVVIEPVEMTNSDKVVSTSSTTPNTQNGDSDTRSALLNHRSQRRKNLSPKERTAALHAFQEKLGSLTFLDPACGSGNFLTETYLSLRRLENRVISILNKGEKILGFDEFIKVHINQFYGIEINDFAVTVAKTALWIAESQMVAETEAILSQTIDFLPLKTAANIVEGNALRMDWATLQPLEENAMPTDGLFAGFATHTDGTAHRYDYIMGNPPFVGYKLQNEEQKSDLALVMPNFGGNIDYVSAWYVKAAELMKSYPTIKAALVSTNSITQGEQVAVLWKPLFEKYGVQLDFAWRTFRWDSESTEKAHVHCVIIGFSHRHSERSEESTDVSGCRPQHDGGRGTPQHDRHSELVSESASEMLKQVQHDKPKFIFDENGNKKEAAHINGYLLDAPNLWIEKRTKPLCNAEQMIYGSEPREGGFLILSEEERAELLKESPFAEKWIKRFVGSEDFLNNKVRYCLWFKPQDMKEANRSKIIAKRLEDCRAFREQSKQSAAHASAATPYLFTSIRQPETDYMLVPVVSSETRQYIPIGYLKPDVIASNACFTVPNASLYTFGILTSRVHNAWMRVVCGRLKSDYRYSNTIVYNNFPWCSPTAAQKEKIEKTAQAILDARAKYADWSFAELYKETIMPPELRRAHRENDKAVMSAYGFAAKMREAEIVAELFKMYERLTRKA